MVHRLVFNLAYPSAGSPAWEHFKLSTLYKMLCRKIISKLFTSEYQSCVFTKPTFNVRVCIATCYSLLNIFYVHILVRTYSFVSASPLALNSLNNV